MTFSLFAILTAAAFLLAGGIFFKCGVEGAVAKSSGRLGADLMLFPKGADLQLQQGLIGGVPVRFALPEGIEGRIAGIPGIGQIAPQYFLASAMTSCCETGNLLLVGFDPKRDFTVLPWLKDTIRTPFAKDDILVGSGVMKGKGASLLFYNHSFTVAERLERSGAGYFDNAAFIPLSGLRAMEEKSMTGPARLKVMWGKPSILLVRLASGANLESVVEKVRQLEPGVNVAKIPELFRKGREKALSVTGFLPWLLFLVLFIVTTIVTAGEFIYWRGHGRMLALFRLYGLSRRTILVLSGSKSLLLAVSAMLCGGSVAYAMLRLFANYCNVVLGIPFLLTPGIAIDAAIPPMTMLFVITTLCPALLVVVLFLRKETYDLLRGEK
jgi:putative ABC transport system permease protein